MIRGLQRLAGTPASLYIAVDSAEEYAVGDLITVAGTGNAQVDADWTIDTVYRAYNAFFPTPMIVVKDPVNTGAMAATPAQGWIVYRALTDPNANPKAIYPFHVASRLIGTVLSAKKWRVGTQEPPWGTYQMRSGCSWEVDLAASTPGLPASGKCGIVSNHLRGWGPRTVTDGVTTSGSKTITSATAAFNYADAGAAITGAGIPAGTTITPVTATTATLSANATASATGVSFTIGTATGAFMEYSDIEIRQL